MLKRIFGSIITLIVLLTSGYTYYLGDSMYSRYKETVQWNNSSLLKDLHKMPPSLAKNYITPDEKKLFKVLADVNVALNEMVTAGEIGSKENKYWELYEEAKAEIERNNMQESLAVKDVFDDFSLYLKINSSINSAYETMNIEELDNYSAMLASRLSDEHNELENNFLIEMKKIADDYSTLNEFSKKAMSKLGFIDSELLKVSRKVNKSITDDLLKEINEDNLKKFAHIQKLSEMLESKKWGDLLANNAEASKYYSWKESQAILESLAHTNYVPVSSFHNVKDVLAYDSWVGLENKEGFIINHEESKILAVYYDGKELSGNLYVKRGTRLSFIIDYVYIEVEPEPEPEPELDPEEDLEIEDEPELEKEPEEKPEEEPEEEPEPEEDDDWVEIAPEEPEKDNDTDNEDEE